MFIFDLHSHFSFKPANSKNFTSHQFPDNDHWNERLRLRGEYSKLIAWLDKTVVKTSQLHGNAATTGGFRVICNGLYPLERGFIPGVLIREVATLTGHSKEVIRSFKHHEISYFEVLQRAYDNLRNNQNTNLSATGNKYKMVTSFKEIIDEIKSKNDTLCIINSIEGAHAFAYDFFASNGTGAYLNMYALEKRYLRAQNPDPQSYFRLFLDAIFKNVDEVKRTWVHTPFFVTVSHHYYNHIAGHSPSLGGVVKAVANQRGSTVIENHPTTAHDEIDYFFLGIRSWGIRFIKQLLFRKSSTNTKVRRILIDVKHMSPQARLDYYNMLEQGQLIDRIPIIFSHTGISGRKELQKTVDNNHKLFDAEKESTKYFYDGVINAFDDEISTIVKSDGLIGLMIDERRIIGKEIPPEAGMSKTTFNRISKESRSLIGKMNMLKMRLAWGEISQNHYDQEYAILSNGFINVVGRLKIVYLSVIFRQIFHACDVAGRKVLDHLTLGTDYDGVINPIDIYLKSSDMATLASDMEDFWKDCCQSNDPTIKQLYTDHKFSRSPKHWIQKILVLNGLNFLKKYFNDAYLLNGVIPPKAWALTSAEEQSFI